MTDNKTIKINQFNVPDLINLLRIRRLQASYYSKPEPITEGEIQAAEDFLQVLSKPGLTVSSLRVEPSSIDVTLASNLRVRQRLYKDQNIVSVYHNRTKLEGYHAVEKAVLLMATVKANYQFLSDSMVKRWLRGEVKINGEKWLNSAVVRSMQNRVK